MHQKRRKLQSFDNSDQFAAFFVYKLNLSRAKSSPKQRVAHVRRFSNLVHEVCRSFDKS